MKFYNECDLDQFEAWAGGKDTLEVLIDRDDCDSVQQLIEECFGEDDMPSETTINDFLWFDRDTIAQHLGYDDWDEYINGKEEDDEDEEELDGLAELCPFCDEEVILPEMETLEVCKCPKCGKYICPCAQCTKTSCDGCHLQKKADKLNYEIS